MYSKNVFVFSLDLYSMLCIFEMLYLNDCVSTGEDSYLPPHPLTPPKFHNPCQNPSVPM